MSHLPTAATTLACSPPGKLRCETIDAVGEDSIRLRRLGICSGREIELLGRGDPMILRIGSAKIGLSRQLAQLVVVSESTTVSAP